MLTRIKDKSSEYISRAKMLANKKVTDKINRLSVGIFVVAYALTTIGLSLYFWHRSVVNAYLASDLLGQTLLNSDTITFTESNLNNNWPNATGFHTPSKALVDSAYHRLFVSDTLNNRVLVFNLDGSNHLIDREADYVLGQPGFTSLAFGGAQNQFFYPSGLAFNAASNTLFVGDGQNNRILAFDTTNISNGENAIAVLGQANFATNASGLAQDKLFSPGELDFNAASNTLFVVDTNNNRVLVFDVSVINNGENAINVLGQADFTSDSVDTTQSTIDYPTGVKYDPVSSTLFVADGNNNRVLIFDVGTITDGENAVHVLGATDFVTINSDTTQNTFSYSPTGMAIDTSTRRLFISDSGNSRMMVFNIGEITDGEDAVNVLGQTDFNSATYDINRHSVYDGAPDFDPTTNLLYMPDYERQRVMVFDVSAVSDGEDAVDLLGQTDDLDQPVWTTSQVDNQGPNSTGFDLLTGTAPASYVAIDSAAHKLYASDFNNHRVLVFNLDTENNLPDHTADFVLGQPNFTSHATATTQRGMERPMGLAIDSANHRLFVADSRNFRVLVFDTSALNNGMNAINVLGQSDFTTKISTTTQNGFAVPRAVAFDSTSNTLYVANSNRILVFDAAAISDGENAINVLGQSDFITATAGTAQNKVSGPFDLEIDEANKRLFVAEISNRRVTVFDISTITNGENAINVLGQANFITKVSALSQNGMNTPYGLAYNPASNTLFVADSYNSRVLLFDVASIINGENAVYVLGQTNYGSNWMDAAQDKLDLPRSMAYDILGNSLYVADFGNYRLMIYRFVRPTTAALPTVYNDIAYSSGALTTAYGQNTIAFRISSGTLPTGLSINTADGTISGTATSSGSFPLTVQAIDTDAMGSFSGFKDYTLTVANLPVQFSGSSSSVSENGLPSIEINVPVTSTLDVSVTCTVTGGTADTGDYVLSTTTITIPAGSTTAAIPLNLINDQIFELNETLQLSLSSPVNAVLGTATVYTLTITDNDAAPATGGSGLPAEAFQPIANPPMTKDNTEGIFQIIINNGASQTRDRAVSLTFKISDAITKMAISNSVDFDSAVLEDYMAKMPWDLCQLSSASTPPAICPEGAHTVYAKFFNKWGRSTDAVSAIIFYGTEAVTKPTGTSPVPTIPSTVPALNVIKKVVPLATVPQTIFPIPEDFKFSKTLFFFTNEEQEVKYLQMMLNTKGYNLEVNGVYNWATWYAVLKFQGQNKLMGTGIVGEKTRALLNDILEAERKKSSG